MANFSNDSYEKNFQGGPAQQGFSGNNNSTSASMMMAQQQPMPAYSSYSNNYEEVQQQQVRKTSSSEDATSSVDQAISSGKSVSPSYVQLPSPYSQPRSEESIASPSSGSSTPASDSNDSSFSPSNTNAGNVIGSKKRNREDYEGATPSRGKKQKRKRQKYSSEQVALLEKIYLTDPLPSLAKREELAHALKRSARSVQIWFQNKRAKDKKSQKQGGLASSSAPSSQQQMHQGKFHHMVKPSSSSVNYTSSFSVENNPMSSLVAAAVSVSKNNFEDSKPGDDDSLVSSSSCLSPSKVTPVKISPVASSGFDFSDAKQLSAADPSTSAANKLPSVSELGIDSFQQQQASSLTTTQASSSAASVNTTTPPVIRSHVINAPSSLTSRASSVQQFPFTPQQPQQLQATPVSSSKPSLVNSKHFYQQQAKRNALVEDSAYGQQAGYYNQADAYQHHHQHRNPWPHNAGKSSVGAPYYQPQGMSHSNRNLQASMPNHLYPHAAPPRTPLTPQNNGANMSPLPPPPPSQRYGNPGMVGAPPPPHHNHMHHHKASGYGYAAVAPPQGFQGRPNGNAPYYAPHYQGAAGYPPVYGAPPQQQVVAPAAAAPMIYDFKIHKLQIGNFVEVEPTVMNVVLDCDRTEIGIELEYNAEKHEIKKIGFDVYDVIALQIDTISALFGTLTMQIARPPRFQNYLLHASKWQVCSDFTSNFEASKFNVIIVQFARNQMRHVLDCLYALHPRMRQLLEQQEQTFEFPYFSHVAFAAEQAIELSSYEHINWAPSVKEKLAGTHETATVAPAAPAINLPPKATTPSNNVVDNGRKSAGLVAD